MVNAIVIGGGGLRPLSSLPIIEFLRNEGIEIEIIIGSSGGALAGGLSSLNIPNKQLVDIFNKVSRQNYTKYFHRKQVIGAIGIPFASFETVEGFVSPMTYREQLKSIFGETCFEDLQNQFYVMGTDFFTNNEICLHTGFIRDALYASTAIYPFLPPAEINGTLVMDGALSSPIPFKQAIDFGADKIVILTFDFLPDNFLCLSYERKVIQQINDFDLPLIHINICMDEQISVLETNRIEAIIERGNETLKKIQGRLLTYFKGTA